MRSHNAPPLGSVSRLVLWQASRQSGTLAGGMVFGVAWMLCQVAWPYLLGRAVDAGLAHGLAGALPWCAALLAAAGVQAVTTPLRHGMAVMNRLRSSLSIARLVGYHAAQTGRAITATTTPGEIVSTVANDALRLGEVFDVSARLSGSAVAYLAVVVLMFRTDPRVGLLVLVGVPVLGAVLALFVPSVQRRGTRWREATGLLAALAADTVAGLRVLRGIGGEDAFVARYTAQSQVARRAAVEVAGPQAWLAGLSVALPGLLVAAVLWSGARLVVTGTLGVGGLVALYGYATFLITPLRTGIEATQTGVRGLIGGRRVLDVLRIVPAVRDVPRPRPAPPPGAELVDVASGLVVEPGRFTAVVDPDPDAAAAVVTRLGRFDDRSRREAPVLWGGVDHRTVPLRDVRRRIVVNDPHPHLFAGRLIDALDVRAVLLPDAAQDSSRRDRVRAALHVAVAEDAVEALPCGVDGVLTERGRSLSGGQRQRISLARALLTDAEVLVLIQPTSAVDAHTEAQIARRVREARAGRATVVVTESPLLLDRVDVVRVMREGRLVGSGTHRELLARGDDLGALYRAVVAPPSNRADVAARR